MHSSMHALFVSIKHFFTFNANVFVAFDTVSNDKSMCLWTPSPVICDLVYLQENKGMSIND